MSKKQKPKAVPAGPGGPVRWYWRSDEGWVEYDKKVTTLLEDGYKNDVAEVKVDNERFVDLENFLQRRYDDRMKRRGVKRVPPAVFQNEVVYILLPAKQRKVIEELITEYGGLVASLMNKQVTYFVTTAKEALKKEDIVRQARAWRIPIVSEDFIKKCEKEYDIVDCKSYKLKIELEDDDSEEEEEEEEEEKEGNKKESESKDANTSKEEGKEKEETHNDNTENEEEEEEEKGDKDDDFALPPAPTDMVIGNNSDNDANANATSKKRKAEQLQDNNNNNNNNKNNNNQNSNSNNNKINNNKNNTKTQSQKQGGSQKKPRVDDGDDESNAQSSTPTMTAVPAEQVDVYVQPKSVFSGTAEQSDDDPFPLMLTVAERNDTQFSGTISWASLTTTTRFRGKINGNELEFEEYELLTGNEVAVPNKYFASIDPQGTIEGRFVDSYREEGRFKLSNTYHPPPPKDQFRAKSQWRGVCYTPFPFVLDIERRTQNNFTGTMIWPTMENSTTKVRGSISPSGELQFEEYEVITGHDVVDVPNFFTAKISPTNAGEVQGSLRGDDPSAEEGTFKMSLVPRPASSKD